MIAVIPYALESEPPGRKATPVAWAWCALVVVLFLLENLVMAGAASAWMPPSVVRFTALVTASAKLYPPPLFSPAELWTHQFVHDTVLHAGWWLTLWHLLANLAVIGGLGAALERRIGGFAFVVALAVIAPLAALPYLVHAQSSLALSGASGVAAGVIGLGWALCRGERARLAVVYWAVVLVGAVPFRSHMRWLAVAFIAQDLLRATLLAGRGGSG
ncbi:MAG: rhomboid family intramembrane serine protease, partial [Planctomycetes bacterium]|nr:rhomboid family intramembrane serine protease [Planctomycetota bacterium]